MGEQGRDRSSNAARDAGDQRHFSLQLQGWAQSRLGIVTQALGRRLRTADRAAPSRSGQRVGARGADRLETGRRRRLGAASGARLGITLDMSIAERIALTRQLGAFKTSMLQDFEAGRPLEIDAIVPVRNPTRASPWRARSLHPGNIGVDYPKAGRNFPASRQAQGETTGRAAARSACVARPLRGGRAARAKFGAA